MDPTAHEQQEHPREAEEPDSRHMCYPLEHRASAPDTFPPFCSYPMSMMQMHSQTSTSFASICVLHLKKLWMTRTRMSQKMDMDSIKAKLARERENPEEAAKMDADIRESKRSVGARALVEAVHAAQKRGLSNAEIEKELAKEKEEYPKLFGMVLDPRHSPAMLYAMLAQLEAVEGGAKSTHDASVTVGTILVNSFVRPKLGMDPVPLPDSAKPPARR